MSAFAARGWIQNDNGAFQLRGPGFDLFFKLSLRNVPGVQKFGRIALIVAGVLFAILAGALLAVNLYVQSQGTQDRIQRELSQRLGATLHIRRISVTPWFGLKLTGITMPQGDEAAPGDFLKADTFRLRVRLSSLFSHRLIINEVSLVNPSVYWAQNENGKWRLPSAVAQEETETAAIAETAPASTPPTNEPSIAPSNAPLPSATMAVAKKENERAKASRPEVRRVGLTNGNFHFLDRKGRPVATFEGVGFRSSLRNSTELRGNASIARISLRDRFFLKDLKSPLKYDPEELDFSQITAGAAGGSISGQFSMRPGDADSPFSAKVAFHDVQADRILTEAGGPVGMLQGRIEGRLDAEGKTADANALTGTGEIYLRGGEVRKFSLLSALSQLLQIDELNQLQLDQAQVKFHIAPGVVMIDEMLLASPNIRLSAVGTMDFDGKLKLQSQLAIDERVRARLFGGMRESFKPIAEAGFSAVDFQITGTIDRPKTNLMGKLVGKDLRDLGGVINDLLGGSRSDRLRKKKSANEDGFPAPSPSPVPETSDAATATPSP